MSIASKFRADRRQPRQPRHAAREDLSAADVLKPVPDPDWARTVPAAQVEAQRAASGPQQALRALPGGARPAEDIPRGYAPGTGPQPAFTRAPGSHPYGPPAPQSLAELARGSRDYDRRTRAYTPDFAETGRGPRPYAAPEALPSHLLPALSQDTQMLPPAIGDHLDASWPGPGEGDGQPLDAWHEMCAVRYPGHDMHATFGDYAAVLNRVNEITGTRGIGLWPLQALPAADERWGALADVLRETVEALEEGNPALSQAHARLLDAVLAAPDCGTALRLARNAAEAGITGYFRLVPAAPEQAGDAA